ncbi:MAG: hypothetical protein HOM25_04350 [Rhodospirillaceae bacterium]|jgi:aminoglycoside 3-N-acetyltransferase|nr:hypothetical protein [Rhodospirillaceae bacterium]MBT5667652.1 hypothetical protein [Rhodospirillaceae bacterium]
MPVGALSEDDFYRVLDEVVGPEDEVLAVFSGLYTFAHRFRWAPHETPTKLLDVFEDFIGSRRTLVVPAYCFSFPRTRIFDLKRTQTDIGVLPDCAVERPTFSRLVKPMNSYMVTGPRSEEFLNLPCRTAWGQDGALAWLARVNAKILILGVPWHEACSLYHYAEELLSVPYRYHKRFHGDLRQDGISLGSCEEVMYSRSANVSPNWDHGRIYPRLVESGAVISAKHPAIPLEASHASDIVAVTCEMLEQNPYAYVTNDDEVRNWVIHGKVREIASLSEEERFEG